MCGGSPLFNNKPQTSNLEYQIRVGEIHRVVNYYTLVLPSVWIWIIEHILVLLH